MWMLVRVDSRSMDRAELTGQVAVVTGATSGIGRLIALHLAGRGMKVVGVGRAAVSLAESQEEASDRGLDLLAVRADVTDAAAVHDAFEQAQRQCGPPDLVVTCAGVANALGPFVEVDLDAWWRDVAIDLRGTAVTMREAARRMMTRRQGRIVTVYGNLGDQGTPNVSAFASAKAAIARLSECVAGELEPLGVRVVCMHPGFVRTALTERLAWGEPGRRFLPQFGERAEAHWGDGRGTITLIDAIAEGKADGLTGRIVSPDDDLRELTRQVSHSADIRRLRVSMTP
jgi:NAD(P)-dependent dehydrogenase (short-subunit alcohol dehydrogenase family)